MNSLGFDVRKLETPCYVVDESLLEKNLKCLKSVSQRTGCKILLAQKAFSMYSTYPLIGKYLNGTTASGLYEARLGREEMSGGEVHIFSPAYRPDQFDEILSICDHIVFNSFSQWLRFRDKVNTALEKGRKITCGIRVNPLYSEIETEIYNPCAAGSRLGVKPEDFREDLLEGISGLHLHTMCEQNSDVLERTIPHLEKHFGKYLYGMDWLNLGGGHHITRDDYDIERLVRVIDYLQSKYSVQIYLEPGEAVALNAGWLITEVLEVNGENVIIDASAACHMPDVLEMPYRPNIIGAGKPSERAYAYTLGAASCLAGDVIGKYSFDEPLKAGDRLILCDMAIYTMCKNNTFNGIGLPSIYQKRLDGKVELIRSFGYEDFKQRLAGF
ncbi:MAG: carboxynorspermidine decarboxylase [Oscillospiraceae bacterium]|nr:carboxynorspermidine decarboxylase [Oscillospiraceae bacterium]